MGHVERLAARPEHFRSLLVSLRHGIRWHHAEEKAAEIFIGVTDLGQSYFKWFEQTRERGGMGESFLLRNGDPAEQGNVRLKAGRGVLAAERQDSASQTAIRLPGRHQPKGIACRARMFVHWKCSSPADPLTRGQHAAAKQRVLRARESSQLSFGRRCNAMEHQGLASVLPAALAFWGGRRLPLNAGRTFRMGSARPLAPCMA